jgi:hypothetical protein
MIEGSGSGSKPPGSGGPKTMWIRIRIRGAQNHVDPDSDPEYWLQIQTLYVVTHTSLCYSLPGTDLLTSSSCVLYFFMPALMRLIRFLRTMLDWGAPPSPPPRLSSSKSASAAQCTQHLKVPKCEIFDRSDFPDFYTIKPLCKGDFGVKIKKNYINI